MKFIFIFILVSSFSFSQETWVKTNLSKEATLLFPSKAEKDVINGKKLFMSRSNGALYSATALLSMSFLNYHQPEKIRKFYDEFKKGFLNSTYSKMIESKYISLKGYVGVQFTSEGFGKDSELHRYEVKAIEIEGVLYSLSITTSADHWEENSIDRNHFLESFELDIPNRSNSKLSEKIEKRTSVVTQILRMIVVLIAITLIIIIVVLIARKK